MPPSPPLTYRAAGVDVEAADALVASLAPLAAGTHDAQVLGDLGGFAGHYALGALGLRDPVLVSGADGVGTKLELAAALGRHDTVGVDLVAMCVNDVLTSGARPLFFLDYFATARLEPDRAREVLTGVARGCREAGCALLGGETAELPGALPHGRYELAGFAVGVVERDALLGPHRARPGDLLLGLASSGLHANGFSLVRRALLSPDGPALGLGEVPPGLTRPLGDELLTPTRIYTKSVLGALKTHPGAVHAMAHVTGGGLPGNLPRALPATLRADVDAGALDPLPPLYDLLRAAGVARAELERVFNLGVGFVLVVDPARADALASTLAAAGERVVPLGRVVERGPGEGAP